MRFGLYKIFVFAGVLGVSTGMVGVPAAHAEGGFWEGVQNAWPRQETGSLSEFARELSGMGFVDEHVQRKEEFANRNPSNKQPLLSSKIYQVASVVLKPRTMKYFNDNYITNHWYFNKSSRDLKIEMNRLEMLGGEEFKVGSRERYSVIDALFNWKNAGSNPDIAKELEDKDYRVSEAVMKSGLPTKYETVDLNRKRSNSLAGEGGS